MANTEKMENLKKLKKWYYGLPSLMKFLIVFLVFWILATGIDFFCDLALFFDKRPVIDYFTRNLFFALFLMVTFKWELVKAIFKKNTN